MLYDKTWLINLRKAVLAVLGVASLQDLPDKLRGTPGMMAYTSTMAEAVMTLNDEPALDEDQAKIVLHEAKRAIAAAWMLETDPKGVRGEVERTLTE